MKEDILKIEFVETYGDLKGNTYHYFLVPSTLVKKFDSKVKKNIVSGAIVIKTPDVIRDDIESVKKIYDKLEVTFNQNYIDKEGELAFKDSKVINLSPDDIKLLINKCHLDYFLSLNFPYTTSADINLPGYYEQAAGWKKNKNINLNKDICELLDILVEEEKKGID